MYIWILAEPTFQVLVCTAPPGTPTTVGKASWCSQVDAVWLKAASCYLFTITKAAILREIKPLELDFMACTVYTVQTAQENWFNLVYIVQLLLAIHCTLNLFNLTCKGLVAHTELWLGSWSMFGGFLEEQTAAFRAQTVYNLHRNMSCTKRLQHLNKYFMYKQCRIFI